ncbi:MAG: membrane-bound lytic murein transglycosylase MltF [Desulforhopalus sp.]|jgi:membrane-bound lytic murein transglycosylase MltF
MIIRISIPFLLILLILLQGGAATATDPGVEPDAWATKQFTGDFGEMAKVRVVRALVPYSKTFYFLDRGTAKGASHDLLKEFEKELNKKQKDKHLKTHVLIIPTARDKLLPNLQAGLGDLAVGNLTITKERQKIVDFSDPFLSGVDEIVVTAGNAAKLLSVSDLSGKTIHVRKSSSYYESLRSLNAKLSKENKDVIILIPADENLEDEDLLEMVNGGLMPMVVVDSHKAAFWGQIFKNIKIHSDIKVNSGGSIAWAMRKNSPQLKKVVNSFVKKNKKGTLMGNILFKRYLQNTKYVKNALSDAEIKRFNQTIEIFKKYGKDYDFDWLMIAALSYQESGIDQTKKSHAGAIGAMQILPSTARDKNVNIPDIDKIDANIHAGTKYLRFMMDRYFADEKMDTVNKGLFSFASYNAGPAKVAKLRAEAARMGLDPNIWFRNVEIVAAKRIGRETVQYVSNIYKYYVAYKLIVGNREKSSKASAVKE